MSYQAFYRKYRPKTFDEVVGQDHITTTLRNQIMSSRVGHAYLFCGIRGTGKTSLAKLFAKAVNCPNNKDGNPCLDCDICDDISKDSNINVIEIDAASNNGVDNVREIREEVRYMSTKGKYKVYIIDEVHMLSMSAFNALLKTLEEPPAHVIFILATTEVQKIPATILSRCQRFDLKRISVKKIASALDEYMKKEDINVEEKALTYIAKKADGSMRDALSLIEQIVAFSQGGTITLKMVLEVVGAVDNRAFVDLINHIHNNNASKCIEQVNEIYMNGKDIKQFVSQTIEFLRNLIIAASVHESEDILDMSEENVEELKQIAQKISYNKALEYISEFSSLDAKLKYDAQPKITLEIALIRMCSQCVRMPIGQDARMPGCQDAREEKRQEKVSAPVIKKTIDTEETKVVPEINLKAAMPDDIKQGIKMWKEIKENCKDPLKCMLVDTEARYYNERTYCIVCSDNMIKNYVDKNINVIKEKIEGILKKEYHIKVMTKEDYEKEVKTGHNASEPESKEEANDLKHVEEFFGKFGVEVKKID